LLWLFWKLPGGGAMSLTNYLPRLNLNRDSFDLSLLSS
jgi:hypothetical protein